MRFAFSTHVFAQMPLSEAHLADLAAADFRAIELYPTAGHFSLADADRLRPWLERHRTSVTTVHAPAARGGDGPGQRTATLASGDDTLRIAAVDAATQALAVAGALHVGLVVVDTGAAAAKHGEVSRAALCRSLDTLAELAARSETRLAVEIAPAKPFDVEALVDLLEDEIDHPAVGLCFDCGHAHLQGDAIESLESASGHVLAVHLNDNHGRNDDHLLPFEGSIDWAAMIMTLQKVGFDGPLVFTPSPGRPLAELVRRAQASRQRLEDLAGAE
ncbi:MAG: sugar phosphate isomerase/epimerase family protein [Vicinamibacterales bacterium]